MAAAEPMDVANDLRDGVEVLNDVWDADFSKDGPCRVLVICSTDDNEEGVQVGRFIAARIRKGRGPTLLVKGRDFFDMASPENRISQEDTSPACLWPAFWRSSGSFSTWCENVDATKETKTKFKSYSGLASEVMGEQGYCMLDKEISNDKVGFFMSGLLNHLVPGLKLDPDAACFVMLFDTTMSSLKVALQRNDEVPDPELELDTLSDKAKIIVDDARKVESSAQAGTFESATPVERTYIAPPGPTERAPLIFNEQRAMGHAIFRSIQAVLKDFERFTEFDFRVFLPPFDMLKKQTADRAEKFGLIAHVETDTVEELPVDGKPQHIHFYNPKTQRLLGTLADKVRATPHRLFVIVLDEGHSHNTVSGAHGDIVAKFKDLPNAVILCVTATPFNLLTTHSQVPNNNYLYRTKDGRLVTRATDSANYIEVDSSGEICAGSEMVLEADRGSEVIFHFEWFKMFNAAPTNLRSVEDQEDIIYYRLEHYMRTMSEEGGGQFQDARIRTDTMMDDMLRAAYLKFGSSEGDVLMQAKCLAADYMFHMAVVSALFDRDLLASGKTPFDSFWLLKNDATRIKTELDMLIARIQLKRDAFEQILGGMGKLFDYSHNYLELYIEQLTAFVRADVTLLRDPEHQGPRGSLLQIASVLRNAFIVGALQRNRQLFDDAVNVMPQFFKYKIRFQAVPKFKSPADLEGHYIIHDLCYSGLLFQNDSSKGKLKIVRIGDISAALSFYSLLFGARRIAKFDTLFEILPDFGKERDFLRMGSYFRSALQYQHCPGANNKPCDENCSAPNLVNGATCSCGHVHRDLRQYTDLKGLPCLLILVQKGRMGDTFPSTFNCMDLRLRYHKAGASPTLSTAIQELGRMCRYVTVRDAIRSESESAVLPYALVGSSLHDQLEDAIAKASQNNSLTELIHHAGLREDKLTKAKTRDDSLTSADRGYFAPVLTPRETAVYDSLNTNKSPNIRRFLLQAEPQIGKTATYLYVLTLIRNAIDEKRSNALPAILMIDEKDNSCEGARGQAVCWEYPQSQTFNHRLLENLRPESRKYGTYIPGRVDAPTDRHIVPKGAAHVVPANFGDSTLVSRGPTDYLASNTKRQFRVTQEKFNLSGIFDTDYGEVSISFPNDAAREKWRSGQAETGLIPWIFTPSHNRATFALLDYRQAVSGSDEKRILRKLIHVIVVWDHEFDLYCELWGDRKIVLSLPRHDDVERGRIGFARYFIYGVARKQGQQFIWMLDDNILCFKELVPVAQRDEDGVFAKECSILKVLQHVSRITREEATFVHTDPFGDCNSEHAMTIGEWCGPTSAWGVVGLAKFRPTLGQLVNPFSYSFVSSAFLINLKTTSEKGIQFQKDWPYYEDLRFEDDCDAHRLQVIKFNRFIQVKVFLSDWFKNADLYKWIKGSTTVVTKTTATVPSIGDCVASLAKFIRTNDLRCVEIVNGGATPCRFDSLDATSFVELLGLTDVINYRVNPKSFAFVPRLPLYIANVSLYEVLGRINGRRRYDNEVALPNIVRLHVLTSAETLFADKLKNLAAVTDVLVKSLKFSGLHNCRVKSVNVVSCQGSAPQHQVATGPVVITVSFEPLRLLSVILPGSQIAAPDSLSARSAGSARQPLRNQKSNIRGHPASAPPASDAGSKARSAPALSSDDTTATELGVGKKRGRDRVVEGEPDAKKAKSDRSADAPQRKVNTPADVTTRKRESDREANEDEREPKRARTDPGIDLSPLATNVALPVVPTMDVTMTEAVVERRSAPQPSTPSHSVALPPSLRPAPPFAGSAAAPVLQSSTVATSPTAMEATTTATAPAGLTCPNCPPKKVTRIFKSEKALDQHRAALHH